MKPSSSLALVLKPRAVASPTRTISTLTIRPTFRLKSCRENRKFQSKWCYTTPDKCRPLHVAVPLASPSKSAPVEPNVPLAEGSFADPTRPDLFYHLTRNLNAAAGARSVYALSFLPTSPARLDAPEVIGWLPAETSSSTGDSSEAGLNDFKENPGFRTVLHEAIQAGLKEGVDDIQINGAIQTQEGWMHIHDDRNIPALGRIGDPDDIIASVLVEGGKILAETYQAMPAYRLCTSDGVTQLTPGLAQKLREKLLTSRKRK
ncbi:hypothetical protein HGRIS_012364 [Hohenbuehelia grisea]|uniref:Uncharacterized protein n=1 Tax=Hohenbuehelia grisea TaxID=104357 RepID=A0ABR3IS34_9AGAR